MSRDRVAFVAAPYGFGPSSKAIAISSHLPKSLRSVFFGDGPPLELARSSGAFSDCFRLDFRTSSEPLAEALSSYGTVVFVNSTRYLDLSSRRASSVIFVDTLAWLRSSRPVRFSTQSAYFGQRFFDRAFAHDLETETFHPTGAIVARTITEGRAATGVAGKTPVVHCGGLCSPAMKAGADQAFVRHLCDTLEKLGVSMRVILPKHLHSAVSTGAARYISLIDCSPINVREHVEGSQFALTTSGIEFTYESLLLGVPTLFLPPFNATQLLQLDYHHDVFAGCIPFALDHREGQRSTSQSLDTDSATIQEHGVRGIWAEQFGAIGRDVRRVLSGGHMEMLTELQRAQHRAVAKVGSDGAETIATHVLNQVGTS
jgi:hypothetical protein